MYVVTEKSDRGPRRGPGRCRVQGAPPHRQLRYATGVSRWILGGAAAICGLRPVMQGRCVEPVRSAYVHRRYTATL